MRLDRRRRDGARESLRDADRGRDVEAGEGQLVRRLRIELEQQRTESVIAHRSLDPGN